MLQDQNFSNIFTFTRASSAMDVDASGRLLNTPSNGLRNSASMSAVTAGTPGTLPSIWARYAGGLTVSVVGSGIDPTTGRSYVDVRFLGPASSTTGTAIYFETGSSVPALPGQTWTIACDLSVVGGSLANVSVARLVIAQCNSSGTAIGNLYGAALLPLSSTPTRFSTTVTTTVAGTAFVQPDFEIAYSAGAQIDVTIRISAPQVEQNGAASTYIPTTGTAATGNDRIRAGFDPVTFAPQGWLIEGSSSNLIPASNFASGWTLSAVTLSGGIASPTGATDATAVVEDASSNEHYAQWSFASPLASTVYAVSAFLKGLGGRTTAALRMVYGNGAQDTTVTYTLTGAGSIYQNTQSVPATITSVGNGWYRCSMLYTTPASPPASTPLLFRPQSDLGAGGRNFTGANGPAWYVYGPQVEQNYCASSYIPTYGTSTGRTSDSFTVAGSVFTGLFGTAAQGTVVLDVTVPQISAATNSQHLVSISDGTTPNRILIRNSGGTTVVDVLAQTSGVSTAVSGGTTSYTPGVPFRVGMRWGNGVVSICKDGGAPVVGSAGTLPTGLTVMHIGNAPNLSNPMNGRVRMVRAYGYALSDSAFQAACVPGA